MGVRVRHPIGMRLAVAAASGYLVKNVHVEYSKKFASDKHYAMIGPVSVY